MPISIRAKGLIRSSALCAVTLVLACTGGVVTVSPAGDDAVPPGDPGVGDPGPGDPGPGDAFTGPTCNDVTQVTGSERISGGVEDPCSSPYIEMAALDDHPLRLGHIAWDDPCVTGDRGQTCLQGWEPDALLQGSFDNNPVGIESTLYYRCVFRFGGGSGGVAPVNTINRVAFCPYLECLDGAELCNATNQCPDDVPLDYDINNHLIGVTAETFSGMNRNRTMFAVVRLASQLFFIGGLDSGLTPVGDVETNHQ